MNLAIPGESNFSEQLKKFVIRFKRKGYNVDALPQTAAVAIKPVMVDGYTVLFKWKYGERERDFDMLFVENQENICYLEKHSGYPKYFQAAAPNVFIRANPNNWSH